MIHKWYELALVEILQEYQQLLQVKFHNEMEQGYRNFKLDGLSDCNYREYNNTTINNQTHINVSI
jgi:hypothetical protein